MFQMFKRSLLKTRHFRWNRCVGSMGFSTSQHLHYCSGTVNFQTKDFKLHKLECGPSTNVHITKSECMDLYYKMKAIREMELAVYELNDLTDEMCGPSHLCDGQEACAVGIASGTRADDAVITAYRLHGYAYMKGLTMHEILAELLGRQTGGSKGKGGSMHLYKKSSHFYGGFGIVGSEVPIGVGIALARRTQIKDTLCVTLYGDGAAQQGQVFEAFNLAHLWNLPVLFVCENNKRSRLEATPRVTACMDLYTKGNYIPGIWVDGMDVLAVKEATHWAANYIRSGKGPLVMELDTFYYGAHFCGHKTLQKGTKTERQKAAPHERDPVIWFRSRLTNAGVCSEQELQEIDNEVDVEVSEAVERSLQDPKTDLHEMYTDIYVDSPDMTVRGCDVFSTSATTTS